MSHEIEFKKEPKTYEKFSEQWFLDLYFKYGSVEEAFASYPEYLPLSIAQFHRIVSKAGIVRSAGRHTNLPEVLHFFKEKALSPGTPLAELYREMPASFKTSLVSLHRIYHLVVNKKITRRYATALIISKESDPSLILCGRETQTDIRYGKTAGQYSVPMAFSKKQENIKDSILRVLQQEVFMNDSIEGSFPDITLDANLSTDFYFDLLDVRLSCIKISIPDNIDNFSSYKLENHHWFDLNTNSDAFSWRMGVPEILEISRGGGKLDAQPVVTSLLNLALSS